MGSDECLGTTTRIHESRAKWTHHSTARYLICCCRFFCTSRSHQHVGESRRFSPLTALTRVSVLLWGEDHRARGELQQLRTQTCSISPSHSEITWNIWTIYTARFSPSLFLFVFVAQCSDVFTLYYPHPDWCRVYILSPERSSKSPRTIIF